MTVTAEGWDATDDWAGMLGVLADVERRRKLRLWCAAWARDVVAAAPTHPPFQVAGIVTWFTPAALAAYARGIEAAEAFADGQLGHNALGDARAPTGGPWNVFHLPTGVTRLRADRITPALGNFVGEFGLPSPGRLASLLRDIFGNPFRPVTFSPEWRTDTAVALARTMYEARGFSAMPILTDALQDAGCDNEDVLSHCRDAALTHVRGCWVIDGVLGRQ